jgi:hypothetical protein
MGKNFVVILGALGAAIGVWLLYNFISKSGAVANASTPKVTTMTPVNPIPVNLNNTGGFFAGVTGFINSLGSPSKVSPSMPTSVTGGALVSGGTNAVQGPSYTQFLSQQTDASLASASNGYNNLPLSALPPSLVLPDNAINSSMVMAGPAGVDPPGISEDWSTYSGTADAFYS